MLIEVSDSTLMYDREEKIPLYAQAKIMEVWLVDINSQIVEVYQQPTDTGYQLRRKFTAGQNLTILALPDVNITVNQILVSPSLPFNANTKVPTLLRSKVGMNSGKLRKPLECI